jgi:hypothetical protein
MTHEDKRLSPQEFTAKYAKGGATINMMGASSSVVRCICKIARAKNCDVANQDFLESRLSSPPGGQCLFAKY